MKGGYQILDLTGATAGSPVEVKGIYKAAAGNNGKPVLILTNDGQRVYAEIAEDDGDYITCYISAEGKTINITIKSDDSVTTVVSDPGASITGLEQAVNELNSNKAAKSDITNLVCTGTKNTTGSTIAAGRYFYLNGALCKATADIANEATFTLNTNFVVVTIDEELRALNSNIGAITDPQFTKIVNYRLQYAKIGKLVILEFLDFSVYWAAQTTLPNSILGATRVCGVLWNDTQKKQSSVYIPSYDDTNKKVILDQTVGDSDYVYGFVMYYSI